MGARWIPVETTGHSRNVPDEHALAPRRGVAGAADAGLGFHLARDEVRRARIAASVFPDAVHRGCVADPRAGRASDQGLARATARRLARRRAAGGAERGGLAHCRDPRADDAARRPQRDPRLHDAAVGGPDRCAVVRRASAGAPLGGRGRGAGSNRTAAVFGARVPGGPPDRHPADAVRRGLVGLRNPPGSPPCDPRSGTDGDLLDADAGPARVVCHEPGVRARPLAPAACARVGRDRIQYVDLDRFLSRRMVAPGTPPAASGLSMMMIPALGVFSSMWLLAERPRWQDYVALALIIFSLATVLLPASLLPSPAKR